MQRVAVINSLLICTTFANTNIYNSSNGWIPLRLTEQSSRIKSVFKEATDFNNNLFKPSDSQEELPKPAQNRLIMSQVKSPQSNKIFFLQPDTKESSEIFASPAPKVQGVKETTIRVEDATRNNDSNEISSPVTSQPTMTSLFYGTNVKGTAIEEANNDSNEISFPETNQPAMNSLFYGTTSRIPTAGGEMVVKILKKEPDTLLENQNKTMGETSNVNQSQKPEENKFDNDLHNFYEKVLMTRVTSTEAASIRKMLRGKKNGDVETSTTSYDSTQGYVGNANEIRKPVVVPISPRNVVNGKIINLLMKYNSKSLPMLNNYAMTKTNFNDYTSMFNSYRHQRPSLIAIPFRYNILNHLPVNPLLAVFLSNYGYSFKDSDNGSQISKKLYGYSNNIHNHGNPFTSEDDSHV